METNETRNPETETKQDLIENKADQMPPEELDDLQKKVRDLPEQKWNLYQYIGGAIMGLVCGYLLTVVSSYPSIGMYGTIAAALLALAPLPRTAHPRRIAVLGDMLELGTQARVLHEGLAGAIGEADVDLVFAAGPNMRHLFDALPAERRGAWAATSAELQPAVVAALAAGDVVMIKGSNGSRMAPLVAAVKSLAEKAA